LKKDLLDAFEKGELKSTAPSKAKLAKFKAAASATFIKDRRINIRLSTPDLMDIQHVLLKRVFPIKLLLLAFCINTPLDVCMNANLICSRNRRSAKFKKF
jgi:predicted DNA binding CopG/RHH family protein